MKKEELDIVIAGVNIVFNKIKEKYVGTKWDLVFSSPYGQCELTSDPMKILEEFPDMIHDSEYKEKAFELIKRISTFEKAKKDSRSSEAKKIADKGIKKASEYLDLYITELDVKGDTFIELRFKKCLSYDQIFELQKDPLVSQKHTPQTRSSIRIVIGTLDELLQSQYRVIM